MSHVSPRDGVQTGGRHPAAELHAGVVPAAVAVRHPLRPARLAERDLGERMDARPEPADAVEHGGRTQSGLVTRERGQRDVVVGARRCVLRQSRGQRLPLRPGPHDHLDGLVAGCPGPGWLPRVSIRRPEQRAREQRCADERREERAASRRPERPLSKHPHGYDYASAQR